MRIEQPTTLERRIEVAATCSSELALEIPLLVDDLEDSVSSAYAAWPDRLFIIGPDARIAYTGARGPRGFDVEEMAAALDQLLQDR